MNKRLPIFVYGTLLPGHPNFRRIFEDRKVDTQRAKLINHAMLGTTESYFPYLVSLQHVPECWWQQATPTVTGQLLFLPEEDYDELLARLDTLEGVDFGHYERRAVKVITGSKDPVLAWCYRLPEEAVKEMLVSPFCQYDSWSDHVRKHDTYKIEE